MNFKTKLILPLGVMAFVISTLLSAWSIGQLRSTVVEERIARRIQGEVDDFYQLVLEAKAAQRGYLLTGNAESLEVYRKSVDAIPSAFDELRLATSAMPSLAPATDDVENLMSKILDHLKPEPFDSARSFRSDNEAAGGESLMSELRSTLDRIDTPAARDVDLHQKFYELYASTVFWTIGSALAAGLALIWSFAFFVKREMNRRAKNEAELLAAQDAALVASKAKSRFLATMSHEIRTPLNGIIGMSDVLRRRISEPESKRYTEIIHDAGQALLRIVNDILDYSKIEAGRIDFEYSEFSILHLTESTAELYLGKVKEKNLSLYTYVDPKLPKLMIGDPTRISQILRNLVSNAIKFTGHGGVLIVVRAVRASKQEKLLRIEVRDTGRGIGRDQMELLFQPFNQIPDQTVGSSKGPADVPTETPNEGTGLGLSISKELAERMGGRIGVDSDLGTGSVFWFELPLKAGSGGVYGDDSSAINVKGAEFVVVTKCPVLVELVARYANEFGVPFSQTAIFDQEFLQSPRIVLVDPDHCDGDISSLPPSTESAIFVLTHGISTESVGSKAVSSTRKLVKPVSRERFIASLGPSKEEATAEANREDAAPTLDISSRRILSPSEMPVVLVVDDNQTNQILAETLLRELECQPHFAANGQEALEAMSRLRYDLVLMDCRMPVMDGYEATREIRRRERSHGIRTAIVALTANASAQDRQRCLESGMDDFLSKPFEHDDLARILGKWIGDRRRGPVDWPCLIDLERKTNPAVVERMVVSFLETIRQAKNGIESALTKRDSTELRRWSHHLRGSSALLGASELNALCERVESLVEAGRDYREIEEAAARIPFCLDNTAAAFAQRARQQETAGAVSTGGNGQGNSL